jgi:hypothetical protein
VNGVGTCCTLSGQSEVVCLVPPTHPADMGGQVAAMFRVRGLHGGPGIKHPSTFFPVLCTLLPSHSPAGGEGLGLSLVPHSSTSSHQKEGGLSGPSAFRQQAIDSTSL